MSTSHAAWRLDVARRAAAVYASNPKVAAIAAAGSVGSGIADEWSDLELDVYWHAPPTDEDRRRPIDVLGGEIEQYWPYNEHEEEWSEEYSLGALGVGISSFVVESARRFIRRVTVDGDPATIAQIRVAAIRAGAPLTGVELLADWKQQTETYPDVLQRRMVERYLQPDRLAGWQLRDALVHRGDLLALHDVIGRAGRSVIGTLHGLNRVLLGNPLMKWERMTVAQFRLQPPDLPERLGATWAGDLGDRVRAMEGLLEDTVEIAERELGTSFDETRRVLDRRRPALPDRPTAL
jgi:hypothetical protein